MALTYKVETCEIIISENKDEQGDKSLARAYVQKMLDFCHLSISMLVRELNNRYPDKNTTVQNLSNKITRGTLRDYEIAQIADVCGFTLKLEAVKQVFQQVHSDNALPAGNETPNLKVKDENTASDSQERPTNEEMLDRISHGYTSILSQNFGVVVFAGENATRATDFYNKCVGSVTPMQELAFLKLIEKEYNVISEFYIKPNISEQEDVTEMPHK